MESRDNVKRGLAFVSEGSLNYIHSLNEVLSLAPIKDLGIVGYKVV